MNQLLVRFEEKYVPEPNSGCWLWIARIGRDGYGRFRIGRNNGKRFVEQAHRAAWKIYGGVIPEGKFVLHKCDIRQCVNPQHLFLGTHDDNMADCKAKDRTPRGERCGHAKLDAAQVNRIRLIGTARSQNSVGMEYGVCAGTIGAILRRKTWKHLV